MYNYITKRLKKKNRGFTLIEVIVVIGILAILAALAIPAVAGYMRNARHGTNMANAKMIYNAESAYYASNPTITSPASPAVLTAQSYLASEPRPSKGSTEVYTVTGTPGAISVSYPGDTNAGEPDSAVSFVP